MVNRMISIGLTNSSSDKYAVTSEVTTQGITVTDEVGITGGTTLLKTEEDLAITVPLPD
jgi:hypothetical protein